MVAFPSHSVQTASRIAMFDMLHDEAYSSKR